MPSHRVIAPSIFSPAMYAAFWPHYIKLEKTPLRRGGRAVDRGGLENR